ncbi:MAG: RlmE family RNA methyltransferase [Thermoplasmata archaeon]|nr:MAG: RlmE family RNA methyltransferase [Thermoplasmata archaeon]
MSKRWLKEHRKETYYRQAKKSGYRSRAAYKLLQINKKFRIFKANQKVLDLGAAPGGWSQVAVELVAPSGTVIGVDIDPIKPLEGAEFIKGDMTSEDTMDLIKSKIDYADVIISDMSPNISGHYSVDQAKSVYLAEQALDVVVRMLKPGGHFIVKIFQGEDFPEFLQKLKERFEFCKVHSPPASRAQSSEVYVVCKGAYDKR